jgi:uncharacterized protein (DUF488 family)
VNGGIFAIGHSTRPLKEFVELLKAHGIELLADIRTVPKSRHNPQFGQESLAKELPSQGIEYRHMQALGGLRRPRPDSTNLAWENSGFRGYADYMQTEEFGRALDELMSVAREKRVAVMCAEGNPFRCHRQLLADALTARGVPTYHIVSRKTARAHKMTTFAVVRDGVPQYPAANITAEKNV